MPSCGTSGQPAGPTLTVTSTGIANGMFNVDHTCAGANTSPAFNWTAGPASTRAYAVVLQNLTTCAYSWIAWDIPPVAAGMPSLAANLPAGQFAAIEQWEANPAVPTHPGYSGPCPGGQTQTYRFTVYAQDVAKLPSLDYSATLTAQQVLNVILQHDVAGGTLTATSSAVRP